MCTMSHPDLSSTNSSATKESRVNENIEKFGDDSNVKGAKCVSNDRSSPDRCLRDRVLKEVGLTSSAFIGPAFPPETSTAKCDIEDLLSLFYKDLEKIDTPDGVNNNPKGDVHVSLTHKNTQNVPDGKIITTMTPAETNRFQNNSGQRESSWPHWYQNEPYHYKRPVPSSVSTQWPYPSPPNKPPFPRFHRPPFPHQPQQSAYQTQQNPPPHSSIASSNSGMNKKYYDEFIHPAFPPPDICNHPSQGFQGNPTPYFGRDDQGYRNKDSDDVTVGWSQGRRDEWTWCDEDYGRPQTFISENKQWQQQHNYQPHDNTLKYNSASVLILMRGLPGSGKTTLARELLSIGPSGVILSTDDYFAQKDGYRYDLGLLGAAHEWNQNRANDAMKDGCSPVIIDNTNLQAWEMKPYVKMALERGYKVDFREPDTSWKFDPYELEKRNKHGVPQEKITQMMDRFSYSISIDIVMRSEEPAHVNQRRQPEQLQIRRKHFY